MTVIFLILALVFFCLISCGHMESFTASQGSSAVIVEPRQHKDLQRVIQNFDAMLPPQYDIYLFHGRSHANFARAATTGVKRVCHLVPLESDNLTAAQYNALLVTKSFWDQVHAENILVFQTDTAICGSASRNLSRFEQFDYIGCPYGDGKTGRHRLWANEPFYGIGGLSFRKKSAMMACIARGGQDKNPAEDVFFSACQHNKEPRPASDDLRAFCTQHKFAGSSLGAHKNQRYDA